MEQKESKKVTAITINFALFSNNRVNLGSNNKISGGQPSDIIKNISIFMLIVIICIAFDFPEILINICSILLVNILG